MRRTTAVGLALVGLAACGGGDAAGPGAGLQPGAYALDAAHGTLPGYRAGVTTYVGTVTLAAVTSGTATGAYALTRTFTPTPPCGADCGPYVSTVTGDVTGAWTAGQWALAVHGLEVRVGAGDGCAGRARGDDLGGVVYATLTRCTITRTP